MTKYATFAELAAQETAADYRVRWLDRPASKVIIIAPHGGLIEVGTSEIAEQIAGDDHSLFCFEGLKPARNNRELHITSHRFDHPQCLLMAARHDVVVSVHGCRGDAQIFVGGLDLGLSGRLTRALAAVGYDVRADGHRYPGRHPHNICNRGVRGMGAQLEITYDLRIAPHQGRIARTVRTALEA